MKRKLALLLAGTMVLSTVSTSTIFAANGEMNMISTIQQADETDPTSALVQIGDFNQVLPANAAFTFELVNGKFKTDAGKYFYYVGENTSGSAIYVAEKDMSITSSQFRVANPGYTTTNPAQLGFDFVAIDENQPVYLKVVYSNVSGFTGKEIQISQVANASVTASITKAKQQNSNYANQGKVTLTSNLAGGIEAGDEFKFTLPTGYTFANAPTVEGKNWGGTYTLTQSSDKRSYTLKLGKDYAETSAFGGTIELTNIAINSEKEIYGTAVEMTIKHNNKNIKTGEIITFNTYGLKATTDQDKVKKLDTYVSGALDTDENLSAVITIEENLPASYRGGDLIVTINEEVKIIGADILNDKDADAFGVDSSDIEFVKKDGKFTNQIKIHNAQGDGRTKLSLDLRLVLSADTDFTGDVTAAVTSKNTLDVPQAIEVGTIAKFASPFSATAEVKEVLAGYTKQQAGDIVVTEKVPGTFYDGQKFVFEIADNGYAGGYSLVDADVEITNGEGKVKIEKTSSSAIVTLTDIEDGDKPVTITLKNVLVSSSRNVPTYIDEAAKIKLTVTNNAGVAEYKTLEADYIKFVSELSKGNPSQTYNQNVQISLGSDTATLADGTKVELYGAPYISADGNYMAPVKGFAYALGLTPEDIVFDNEAKIATFFLADGSVAQVQAGNKYATVNGQNIPLIDANGNIVTPVIKEGRFYLPLRSCAKTIFGVDVDYNAADKSVVLNPSK